MVVYIEYLIFDNFCADAFLGALSLVLLNRQAKLKKIALSAAMGTAVACAYIYIPTGIMIAFKLVSLLLCCLLLEDKHTVKSYLRLVFVYTALSALLFGFAILIFGFSSGGLSVFVYPKKGAIGLLTLSALIVLYAARQLAGLKRERETGIAELYSEFCYMGKTYKARAYYDSCNFLRDVEGKPVIVLDGKLISNEIVNNNGYITVNTVGGRTALPVIIVENLKVTRAGNIVGTYGSVSAAVSKTLCGGELILNSVML